LIEPDRKDALDEVLIIQMLLEHEKRLKRIDDELRKIREYLTDIDALQEQHSEWLRVTEKLKQIESRRGRNLHENR
jgi:hypothetical protein